MGKYLSISLSVVIFLVFLFNLFANSLNAPSFDDYDTTLSFIKKYYFENDTFTERLATLFSRHNEHRILFSKCSAAAYYAVFGHINFAHLVLFQNLFLLAFFGLMLAIMKQQRLLTPDNVLVAAIFLLSLAFWQVTFYYWGGIQHYTVFFFSFLSLFLLHRADQLAGGSFVFAVLAGMLAVLSFGNGFLALLVGGFLLFAQRKYTLLSVWAVISMILLYITFFPRPESAASGPFHVTWMLRLLFTFLGSFLYVNPGSGQAVNIIICMLAGVAVAGVWLWLFWKGYAFKNPMLYGMLSLPVLTGIIISISRFETKAAGGIAPRYMFFTATIPVILLLILLDLHVLRQAHVKIVALAGVLFWAVVFYTNKNALESSNRELTETIGRWKKDPGTPLIYYRDAATYSAIMSWAVDNQVVDIDHIEPGAGQKMRPGLRKKVIQD